MFLDVLESHYLPYTSSTCLVKGLQSGLTISADITVDLIALGNVDLLFVVVVVVGTVVVVVGTFVAVVGTFVVVVFGGGHGCDDGVENSFYTKLLK